MPSRLPPDKVTFAGDVLAGIWTPDGKAIVYGSMTAARNNGLTWIRADGTDAPQKLTDGDGRAPQFPYCFTRDGQYLLFGSGGPGTQHIWRIKIDSRDPEHVKVGNSEPLMTTPFVENNAAISPAGKWLAYTSNASGRTEVYVRPFAAGQLAGGELTQVSKDGGAYPRWSPAGRQLLFVGPDDPLMTVDYSERPGSFDVGRPRRWSEKPIGTYSTAVAAPFGVGPQPYDISRDGKRVIAWPALEQKLDGKTVHVTMVFNWFDALRRRASVSKQ